MKAAAGRYSNILSRVCVYGSYIFYNATWYRLLLDPSLIVKIHVFQTIVLEMTKLIQSYRSTTTVWRTPIGWQIDFVKSVDNLVLFIFTFHITAVLSLQQDFQASYKPF